MTGPYFKSFAKIESSEPSGDPEIFKGARRRVSVRRECKSPQVCGCRVDSGLSVIGSHNRPRKNLKKTNVVATLLKLAASMP
jgi:hypothetical protein